jgi:hypothetical protein
MNFRVVKQEKINLHLKLSPTFDNSNTHLHAKITTHTPVGGI